ncbi:MAG: hypothetical protein K0R54_1886 [Clostridiaceae bacterium]|jgi:hypothetical protein|nr:hypothetical protein [Clostridiaceae bacterium]
MAAVWNVNSINSPDLKKFSGKISFDIGQVFLARIIKLSDNNNEVLLRLLDGWQFPAELLNQNNISTDKPIKFQVDGFKDGKLQIKVVNQNEDSTKNNGSSIESVLMDQNIELGKEQYDLLENMAKHNMPLTKENISKVKTYIDMAGKIASTPDEQDNFIAKYLNSKNIDINSPKGKEIASTLKSFFNELKNVTAEDIMTMLENGMEINQENIKSYNRLFKEPEGIYKQIKNLGAQLETNLGKSETENIISNVPKDNIENDNTNLESSRKIQSNDNNEKGTINENINNNDLNVKKDKMLDSSNSNKTDIRLNEDSVKSRDPNNKIEKHIDNTQNKDTAKSNRTNILDNKSTVKNSEELFRDIKTKGIEKGTELEIKSQLNSKTEEIKNIIKSVLQMNNEKLPETSNKISQIIKQNISDFKTFNSISNQYYYMDLPVKMDNSNYECKLIVKDDRKKGKKVDTKDVKIAASVNTINMGVVNAYIKIKNSSMNVNIRCSETWIKIIDNSKNNLLNSLCDLGYNVNIEVEKKEQDINLSNCASFFEDSNFSGLNIRV